MTTPHYVEPYPVRHEYSSLIEERIRPHMRRVFIETGTNLGNGIAVALRTGAAVVFSCEEDPALAAEAARRFADKPTVTIAHRDSPSFLRDVLATLDEPALIYLDAHSYHHNPLLAELDAIAASPHAGRHTIAIDDVRMFGTPDWFGLSEASARARLALIGPYTFTYVDTAHGPGDLLVATPIEAQS